MAKLLLAKCYLCKGQTSFSTTRALGKHLTLVHEERSKFRCGQENCFSLYGDLSTFKKHLRDKHHILDKLPEAGPYRKPPSSKVTADNTVSNSDIAHDVDIQADRTDSDEPEKEPMQVEDFKRSVLSFAASFVSKQYADNSLPRKHVQVLVHQLTDFSSNGPLSVLKDEVVISLKSANVCEDRISEIKEKFEALETPFLGLQTEYRRFKYFSESASYVKPITYVLGKRMAKSISEERAIPVYKDACGQFIPLSETLRKFLELPDCLKVILDHMSYLKNDPSGFSNIIQCPLWKKKTSKFLDTDIVLPLIVNFDDFEPNSDLGPHSGKLGAVYTSIACLPPECASRLENIFLTLLFDSHARSEFGNAVTFRPLIDELKKLETEGILVNTPEGERRVFFVTALITGDNLGLNQILGFVACFVANFMCRFCKAHRDLIVKLTKEDVTLLRNERNYALDVSRDDKSSTGVNENCIFNEVPSFHVTENFAVDYLHDFPEGVLNTVILFVLAHCLKNKYFTLETLNFRLDMHVWGPVDNDNKPPLLAEDFQTKAKLKMNGRELMCFFLNFGVLVGDLIPEGDPVYSLYLSGRKVLELVTAKKVSLDDKLLLDSEVSKFLRLFCQLDETHRFKPKEHFLLHYGRVMQQVGPLPNISTWRFEAKHKELTTAASATTSRMSLSYTLAVKQQLSFCQRILANQGILPKTELGPGHIVDLTESQNFNSFERSLPEDFKVHKQSLYEANWVKFKGTKFVRSMALVVGVDNFEPAFAKVEKIIGCDEQVVFVYQRFSIVKFDEHVHGYHVELAKRWLCVRPEDLHDPLPVFASQTVGRGLRIVPRYKM